MNVSSPFKGRSTMKHVLNQSFAFCLTLVFSSAAVAANSITVNWQNSAGASITRNSTYDACQPSGACSMPSSISSGSTGTLTNISSSGTYIRSIQARYRYFNSGVWKSCQVQLTIYGPSSTFPGPGCEDRFNPTFIRSDGTGSSPTCTITSQSFNATTCDAVLNVRISN